MDNFLCVKSRLCERASPENNKSFIIKTALQNNFCTNINEQKGEKMNEQKIIKPRKLSGFMELQPKDQLVFDNMLDQIKSVYLKHNFLPLDTPVLELSEILLAKSGGEIDKEVYRFTKGDTDICMRYDLTVPLARFVAMHNETLHYPFKRFQIGKVYRGERAQKGRFREFVQCDADIIGNGELSLVADGECLKMVDEVFEKLGLDIVNQVSNRNILFGYIEGLGYQTITKQILTILDKISKIGKDNAKEELSKLNIKMQDIAKLIEIIEKRGNFDEILPKIEKLSTNQTFLKGVSELKEVYSYAKNMGINQNKILFDLSIIRGQDYYTGTVFEAIIPSHKEFGTVCGGGRYDNLASYFSEKNFPGVGLSIGFTRLFDLLMANNMLKANHSTNIDLQIIPLGNTLSECLQLQQYFSQQLQCEVAYENRSFKAKMKDANKQNIPYILIVGEDEIKNQIYALKNMANSTQQNLSKEDCLALLLKNTSKN